jgi:hypothetical protein
MAEEASVFGGMSLGQRCFFPRSMAAFAGFLRLFFTHGHEPLVVLIMGEPGRGFGRCIEQEKEERSARRDEQGIIENVFLFSGHAVQWKK